MEKKRLVGIITLILSLCFLTPSFAGKSREYLKYGEEQVRLDIYNPGNFNYPVVILIHGAAGIEGDRADRYARFATDLMKKGIIAINVYYFDSRTENWLQTIIQTINYIENIPHADKDRIGIVGYSLGGTIALKVASIDSRVKALAINSSFLPAGFTKEDAVNLPETLIICGTRHKAIHNSNELKQWFTELDSPFQMRINKGVAHGNVPTSVFQKDQHTVVRFFRKIFRKFEVLQPQNNP